MTNMFKFGLAAIFILVVCQLVLLMTVIVNIKSDGDKEIVEYREEAMHKVKSDLKNHVDMVISMIDSNYRQAMDRQYIEKVYGRQLKSIVDIAEGHLKSYMKRYEKGELSLERAKKLAKEEIGEEIRFDSGTGYVWINDTATPFPRMVMHPTMPSLNGKVLDDEKYNCAMGKNENLFVAARDVSLKKGDGFIDYVWPKPTSDGLVTDVPKISYVRLFKKWNWVLGTGKYVDEAMADMKAKIKDDMRAIRYDNGVGYFWITDMGEPFPTMIMHPVDPGRNNKPLDSERFNTIEGTKENRFVAAVRICKERGDAFLSYRADKPTERGLVRDKPKLSYVRLYKPLGWIVGTGKYIDDIDKAVEKRTSQMKKHMTGLIVKISVVFIVMTLLAIAALVYIDRYTSKGGATELKEKNAALADDEADSGAEADPPPAVNKGDNVDGVAEMAREICRAVAREQAKLIAFYRATEKEEAQDDAALVREMAKEIKALAEKAELSADEVRELRKAVERQRKGA
ncbi:MAG: cache domain-containing protein [Deltaproteobacteria bacterium]|nr:cache domain-containing protein [Deltaproteobacteria bacterium]